MPRHSRENINYPSSFSVAFIESRTEKQSLLFCLVLHPSLFSLSIFCILIPFLLPWTSTYRSNDIATHFAPLTFPDTDSRRVFFFFHSFFFTYLYLHTDVWIYIYKCLYIYTYTHTQRINKHLYQYPHTFTYIYTYLYLFISLNAILYSLADVSACVNLNGF